MSDVCPDPSAAPAACLNPAASDVTAPSADAAEPPAVAPEAAGDEGETVPPEFECSICMKILLFPVTTPCGHNFCRACIEQALSYRPMCPLCRAPLLHCALPGVTAGGGAGRTTLCVNTLLQQLLEAQYPRKMAKRTADAAAAAEAAAETRATRRGERGEGDVQHQQQQQRQRQLLPLFFVMGEQLQRMLQQRRGCRAPLALQASPLVPGETVTLHIHEERYIHLVQLALQGSHHFGIVLPPIESQTVGVRLPQTPVPPGSPTEAPSAAAAASGTAAAEGAAPAAREEEAAMSKEAGVFGCCVQIEQHTQVAGTTEGGPIGVCVIRCVCKNRFRLVDILLEQQDELQLQHQQPQQQDESFETRLSAAVASPDFCIGVCYPVVDEPLVGVSTPTAETEGTTGTATTAEASAAINEEEAAVQQFAADALAMAMRWSRSPLTRASNLVGEFNEVKRAFFDDARRTARGGGSAPPLADLGPIVARRLCEICIEGLQRQLVQGGEVAQRLFSSKYGRIPNLPERVCCARRTY